MTKRRRWNGFQLPSWGIKTVHLCITLRKTSGKNPKLDLDFMKEHWYLNNVDYSSFAFRQKEYTEVMSHDTWSSTSLPRLKGWSRIFSETIVAYTSSPLCFGICQAQRNCPSFCSTWPGSTSPGSFGRWWLSRATYQRRERQKFTWIVKAIVECKALPAQRIHSTRFHLRKNQHVEDITRNARLWAHFRLDLPQAIDFVEGVVAQSQG